MKIPKVLVCVALILSFASAAVAQCGPDCDCGCNEGLPCTCNQSQVATTTYQVQSVPVLANTTTTYYSSPVVTYSRPVVYRTVSRPVAIRRLRAWVRQCAATRPRLLRRR